MQERRAKNKAVKDPYIGKTIDGRFHLRASLGRGGMGMVYRAEQAPLGRQVALKLMLDRGDPDRESEFQQRFLLEAATVAKLKHANTVTVFDYGSDFIEGGDGVAFERVFYIVMEYIEGKTLARAIKKEGPFSAARATHIAIQIARSLREAHRLNIVHRDLKPGNVMLIAHDDDELDQDFVKVLDFGLAKSFAAHGPALTQAGTFLGSPRYVSPEQIEGKKIDPRADIYSLGCVLYRMLTGRVPFTGKAPVEIMMQHLDETPPPLGVDVPIALSELIFSCLEKKRRHRPQSMDEVIRRLKSSGFELGDASFSNLHLEMSSGQSIAPSSSSILADDNDDEVDFALENNPTAIESSLVRRKRLEASPYNRPMADVIEDSEVSWVANEELTLGSTRPSYVLQSRVRGVKRAVILVLLLVFLGALGFAQRQKMLVPFLDEKGWPVPVFLRGDVVVENQVVTPLGIRRKVRVYAQSSPPAEVTLLPMNASAEGPLPKEKGESLGISPVQKELYLAPGEIRILLFERKGHRRVRAIVEGPAEDVSGPLRLDVQTYLPKLMP